ncbi:hypothetical protein J4208_03045 [Candidatus Woesearchaeota archaeon]|nr:hypothetical protein [Candidatus Woesearchaeota archaeon]
MKNVEEIVHVEFTPDPHIAVDCCQGNDGKRAFYQNQVLVERRVESEGKVPFECPSCGTKYEMLKAHIDKAQTRVLSTYATGKD